MWKEYTHTIWCRLLSFQRLIDNGDYTLLFVCLKRKVYMQLVNILFNTEGVSYRKLTDIPCIYLKNCNTLDTQCKILGLWWPMY